MSERTGFFICHCGSNIAGTVDITAVVEHARQVPGVAVAKDYRYMCSDPGQELIKKEIKEQRLTRVVVAACSPTLHELTFRRVCGDSGLNPYLFQMANIREHCSWVTEERALATRKAKKIIQAALARVALHEPLAVREVPVASRVLVVGGGVAGIEAALKMADAGKQVYLVEKEPTIGGQMARFDKTFPTLDCAACILTPKMSEVKEHPNIELLAYSEVEAVSGFVGNFRVTVRKKPTYVIRDKCNSCGECVLVCPVVVHSEFDCSLALRKAIYIPFPQAIPSVYTLDEQSCLGLNPVRCSKCKDVCDAKAIDFCMQPEIIELEVGAIVVATGFELFDCEKVAGPYGYGRLDNVLTSLEFERLCHASGPTGGKIVLSDGREPEAIAILHCIGSRDENYNKYCSRVCCMYSFKFAHLVKEKTAAQVYNLYIDVRAFGKGYEEFYQRCLREGMRAIRGKGAEVSLEEDKLVVRCEDTLTGTMMTVPVDMVVLSAGLSPRPDAAAVARTFGLSRSSDGFFLEKHPKLAPVATSTDGVYVAGACQGPKDIPDSVAQGAAAAGAALALIDAGKIRLEPVTTFVDETRCAGCRVCNALCPYGAIEFDWTKKQSVVNDVLCKGCGTCVSACPSAALSQRGFTDSQLRSEIEGILCADL